MVEQTMMNRQVSTTFCDDIRQEIGGKLSYMGVYSSDLYVGGFPITLPKFCVAIRVMTPADPREERHGVQAAVRPPRRSPPQPIAPRSLATSSRASLGSRAPIAYQNRFS